MRTCHVGRAHEARNGAAGPAHTPVLGPSPHLSGGLRASLAQHCWLGAVLASGHAHSVCPLGDRGMAEHSRGLGREDRVGEWPDLTWCAPSSKCRGENSQKGRFILRGGRAPRGEASPPMSSSRQGGGRRTDGLSQAPGPYANSRWHFEHSLWGRHLTRIVPFYLPANLSPPPHHLPLLYCTDEGRRPTSSRCKGS